MKLTTPRHFSLRETTLLLKLLVVRVIKKYILIGRNVENITYEGIFENFAQVSSTYTENVGYVSKEYLISEKNKVVKIVADSTEAYAGNNRDHYLLFQLSSLLKKKIRILDVGSGFGLTFHYLINNLEIEVEYTGIDLEEISEIALQIFGHHYNFQISDLFNLGEQQYDLVYFGSSLQYFENYKMTLFQILKKSPQIVLIADTPVGDLETFVTCQVNMKNRKIPRWVFSFSEIIEIFKGEGYELINITSVDWHSDIHNFRNFPEEYHHISHKNMVFSRNRNL